MTEAQITEARQLRAAGHSNLSVTRCLSDVRLQEVEDLLGPMPAHADQFSPALRVWWNQQPWVWRPDNQAPAEAPWERVSREWF